MEFEIEKYIVTYDDNQQPTWVVPVVNPNGVIKHVRINPFIQSGLISAEVRRVHGQEVADHEHRLEVGLRLGLREQGWELLADLFRAENAWRKWRAYHKWMVDGDRLKVAVPPFPREHLPQGVTQRTSKQAKHQAVYTFDLGDKPESEPAAEQAQQRRSPRQ
jgi:hypothetical protein